MKTVNKKKNPGLAKLPTAVRNKMGYKKSGGKTSKFKDGDDTHVTKDGRTVKKGLYYYMNKRKKPEVAKSFAKKHGNKIQAKDGKNLSQVRKNSKNPKGVANGCGMVMEDRRKETTYG